MEGGFGGLIQEIRGAVDGFIMLLGRTGIITGACSKTMQMLGLHGDDVSSLTVRFGDFVPSWRQDMMSMGGDSKTRSYFRSIIHARNRQKKRQERRRRMQGHSSSAAAQAAAAAAGAAAAAEVAAESEKAAASATAAAAATKKKTSEVVTTSGSDPDEMSEADQAQNQRDLDYEAIARLRRLGIADRHFILFQRISRTFVGHGLRTIRDRRVVGAWATARMSHVSGSHLPGAHEKDNLCLIKWRPGPFPKNHASLIGSSDEERAAAEDNSNGADEDGAKPDGNVAIESGGAGPQAESSAAAAAVAAGMPPLESADGLPTTADPTTNRSSPDTLRGEVMRQGDANDASSVSANNDAGSVDSMAKANETE